MLRKFYMKREKQRIERKRKRSIYRKRKKRKEVRKKF